MDDQLLGYRRRLTSLSAKNKLFKKNNKNNKLKKKRAEMREFLCYVTSILVPTCLSSLCILFSGRDGLCVCDLCDETPGVL